VVSDLPAVCLREEWLALPALSRLRPQGAVVLRPVFPGLAPAPAAVQEVLQLAESEASAQPGLALQPGEPAAQDAAAVPRVVAEVPLQAAELPGAAAGPQREARDGEAGRQPAAQDAEGLQPVALPSAEPPSVGLPSAAAWAFHRDQVLPWPEPQPVARFVRATARLQIAALSERWWRAVTNVVLS
jgi:hypothetical protein